MSLLRVAAKAFVRRGFYGTSMDEVASELGLSKAVFYRYFDGKDALMEAVLEEGCQRLAEASRLWFEVRPRDGGGLLAALAEVRVNVEAAQLVMQFASREPQYQRFYDDVWRATRRATEDRLSAWMEGVPADHPLWPTVIVQLADFAIDGFMSWIERGDPTRDEDFERWMRASIRSLSHVAKNQILGGGEVLTLAGRST